jgi:hypothetical protein
VQIIYKKLEEEENLKKLRIPRDPTAGESETFVFATNEFYSDGLMKPYLLILIHGGGAVRAGQWSRR